MAPSLDCSHWIRLSCVVRLVPQSALADGDRGTKTAALTMPASAPGASVYRLGEARLPPPLVNRARSPALLWPFDRLSESGWSTVSQTDSWEPRWNVLT